MNMPLFLTCLNVFERLTLSSYDISCENFSWREKKLVFQENLIGTEVFIPIYVSNLTLQQDNAVMVRDISTFIDVTT
jgi:hypothetical protein